MSEVWVRLALILGALTLALVATVVMRGMTRDRPAVIDAAGLRPGVYLFSSATCLDCQSARTAIHARMGPGGFVEIKWEEEPGRFHDLGIDVVPTTVIAHDDGSAEVFAGMPDKALKGLGP
jgi:hypothetical protein